MKGFSIFCVYIIRHMSYVPSCAVWVAGICLIHLTEVSIALFSIAVHNDFRFFIIQCTPDAKQQLAIPTLIADIHVSGVLKRRSLKWNLSAAQISCTCAFWHYSRAAELTRTWHVVRTIVRLFFYLRSRSCFSFALEQNVNAKLNRLAFPLISE